jgi:hypothetical protein
VDSKLLLVAHGSTLWLVDQHAADERVQLEGLQQHMVADLACQQQQQQQQEQQGQHGHAHQQQQQQDRERVLQSVVPGKPLVSAVEATYSRLSPDVHGPSCTCGHTGSGYLCMLCMLRAEARAA